MTKLRKIANRGVEDKSVEVKWVSLTFSDLSLYFFNTRSCFDMKDRDSYVLPAGITFGPIPAVIA